MLSTAWQLVAFAYYVLPFVLVLCATSSARALLDWRLDRFGFLAYTLGNMLTSVIWMIAASGWHRALYHLVYGNAMELAPWHLLLYLLLYAAYFVGRRGYLVGHALLDACCPVRLPT